MAKTNAHTPRTKQALGTTNTGIAGAAGAPGDARSLSDRPRPQPWTTPQDREGWELVAHGQRRGDRPPVSTALMLSLDTEQAEWLEDTAAAAGVSPEQYLRRLLDQARHDIVTLGTAETR